MTTNQDNHCITACSCEHSCVDIRTRSQGLRVHCYGCGLSGPLSGSRQDAIQLWNKMLIFLAQVEEIRLHNSNAHSCGPSGPSSASSSDAVAPWNRLSCRDAPCTSCGGSGEFSDPYEPWILLPCPECRPGAPLPCTRCDGAGRAKDYSHKTMRMVSCPDCPGDRQQMIHEDPLRADHLSCLMPEHHGRLAEIVYGGHAKFICLVLVMVVIALWVVLR